MTNLQYQSNNRPVEIVLDIDSGEVTIGAKRNRMIQSVNTPYLVFVDDDDIVAPNYVSKILQAINRNPDVISFMLEYRTKEYSQLVHFSHKFRRDTNEVRPWQRIPNHLCPVKTHLAQRVGYKNLRYREDAIYAIELKRHVKNFVHINEVLYYYLDFKTNEDKNRLYYSK